jgi:hypothetical protein
LGASSSVVFVLGSQWKMCKMLAHSLLRSVILVANMNSFQFSEAAEMCASSCLHSPLNGFVTLSPSSDTTSAELIEASSVASVSNSFRFLSFNAPNLLRIEVNPSNSIRLPDREEIWDIICSIQQMGGKVITLLMERHFLPFI